MVGLSGVTLQFSSINAINNLPTTQTTAQTIERLFFFLHYFTKHQSDYVRSQKRCWAIASTNSFAKFGLFLAKTTPARLFPSDA